jgi:hypothetical protein
MPHEAAAVAENTPDLRSDPQDSNRGADGCQTESNESKSLWLRDGVIAIYIDFFVFHGTPQSFNKDIITPRPEAIHPDSNAACLEGLRKDMPGQLAPLICIHDVGFSITGDGALKRLQTELNIHRDGHSPGQHSTRIPVHPGDQKCCTLT